MTELPLQIAYRGMDPSEAVNARIRSKVEAIAKRFDHLIECRVVMAKPHKRHHRGSAYTVRVYVGVPGPDVYVTHNHPKDQGHENIYDAIADAFQATEKKLATHMSKLEGDVKTHEIPLHGKIVQLFGEENFGFIETSEGERVYFRAKSVANGAFDRLTEGDPVRLSLAPNEDAGGMHASFVRPIGKHHLYPE